jgi:hypothetical protein
MSDHYVKTDKTVHPEIIKAMEAEPFNLNHFLRVCDQYQEERHFKKREQPKTHIEIRKKMAQRKIKYGRKAQRQLMGDL